MSPLLATLRLDVQLQARSKLYTIGIVVAILLGLVVPVAGIVTGLITVSTALAIVQALEGIFKAALYEYAMGEKPLEFDLRTLQTAYRPVGEGQY